MCYCVLLTEVEQHPFVSVIPIPQTVHSCKALIEAAAELRGLHEDLSAPESDDHRPSFH